MPRNVKKVKYQTDDISDSGRRPVSEDGESDALVLSSESSDDSGSMHSSESQASEKQVEDVAEDDEYGRPYFVEPIVVPKKIKRKATVDKKVPIVEKKESGNQQSLDDVINTIGYQSIIEALNQTFTMTFPSQIESLAEYKPPGPPETFDSVAIVQSYAIAGKGSVGPKKGRPKGSTQKATGPSSNANISAAGAEKCAKGTSETKTGSKTKAKREIIDQDLKATADGTFVASKNGRYQCPLNSCDKAFLNSNGIAYHLEHFAHDPVPFLEAALNTARANALIFLWNALPKYAREIDCKFYPFLIHSVKKVCSLKFAISTAIQFSSTSNIKKMKNQQRSSGCSKVMLNQMPSLDMLSASGIQYQKISRSMADLVPFKEVDEITALEYLPELKNIGIAFGYSTNAVHIEPWKIAMHRSEHKMSWIMNTCIPVWGMDWCPLTDTDGSRYIAVGGYMRMDEQHVFGMKNESAYSKASIQIWKINVPSQTIEIAFHYMHPFGSLFDLKWSPVIFDDYSGLGILACTFMDGSCRILQIPHPSLIKSKFLKHKTGTEIHLHMPSTMMWRCSWNSVNNLAIGCTNGHLAVFKFSFDNVLGQSLLFYTRVHDSSIRSLKWIDDGLIISGGNDGRLMVTSVQSPWTPLQIHRSVGFINSVTGGKKIMAGTALTSLAFVDSGKPHVKISTLESFSEFAELSNASTMYHTGMCRSIATSPCHPFILSVSADGTMKIFNTNKINDRGKSKHVQLLELKMEESTHILTFNEETKVIDTQFKADKLVCPPIIETCGIHLVIV